MEAIYQIILAIHIAGGFTALVIGISVFIGTKGGKYHRISGRIYFWGMMAVVSSAIAMHLLKANTFLFYIALFTLYQVYGGFTSTKNRMLQPKILDIALFIIGTTVAICMLASLKIVLMAFGGLFLMLLFGDFRIFWKLKREKEISSNQWLLRHIGLMGGSYIATSTAFIVLNVQSVEPNWLPWLLPSAIGAPLIAYFTRKSSPYLQGNGGRNA
jgi:uncharacterized membrane protein